MAVRYGSKKYYKEKYEDECAECRKRVDDYFNLKEAFDFVFQNADKDPHRVEVAAYGGICANHYGCEFKYVDKDGVLHQLQRQVNTNKIKVLSTDADGALICYQATKPYTYCHLNKVKETFTEIPAKYMCDFAVAND